MWDGRLARPSRAHRPAGNSCLGQPRQALPSRSAPRHLAGRHCSQLSQNTLRFLRTVPGANGIERASTPPGSLGTSPPGSSDLPLANSSGTLLQLLHRGISMSIFGILSSGFLQKQLGAPSTPNKQSIEQLSKDLQSGNLAAAQSDFSTLQKAFALSVTSAASASAAGQGRRLNQPEFLAPEPHVRQSFCRSAGLCSAASAGTRFDRLRTAPNGAACVRSSHLDRRPPRRGANRSPDFGASLINSCGAGSLARAAS